MGAYYTEMHVDGVAEEWFSNPIGVTIIVIDK